MTKLMTNVSLSVSLLALVACAAPAASDADDSVASADRAVGTNLVYKKLTTPVAPSVTTPVGQRESDVVARETTGATRTGPLSSTSCVETFTKGAAYIEHVACDGGEHALRVWEGGEYTARAYIFRGGVVRTYMAGDGSNAWQLYATDRDDSGKLTEIDQALPLADFTVTGYADRGWSSTKNWFRLLFDTDGDGLFDVEGVTGDWVCTTAEPTGCDSGPSPLR